MERTAVPAAIQAIRRPKAELNDFDSDEAASPAKDLDLNENDSDPWETTPSPQRRLELRQPLRERGGRAGAEDGRAALLGKGGDDRDPVALEAVEVPLVELAAGGAAGGGDREVGGGEARPLAV